EIARAVQQIGTRVRIVGMAMPGTFLPQRIRRILAARPTQPISRMRMACVAVACTAVATVFTAGTVGYAQNRTDAQAVTSAKSPETPVPARKPTNPKRPRVLLAQVQTSPAKPNSPAPDQGSLSGTVEDLSGSVVPQCVITARNQSGAGVEVAVSNSAGFYRF